MGVVMWLAITEIDWVRRLLESSQNFVAPNPFPLHYLALYAVVHLHRSFVTSPDAHLSDRARASTLASRDFCVALT